MVERKTRVKLPTGQEVDAFEVAVEVSVERWSEVKLEDGTSFRAKMNVLVVHRIPDHWDPQGDPLYTITAVPVMAIIEAPEHLRKKVQ